MVRLILTEDDKKDIKLQYQGIFDRKFYDFLKSNVDIDARDVDFSSQPFVLIYVDGKSRLLNNSKKYLVNVLINAFEDDFSNLNAASLRLTAKKFIDDLKKQYFFED